MPGSVRENDADIVQWVQSFRKPGKTRRPINTALDVGAGEGTYHRILGELIPAMDAIEVHEPNIVDYSLAGKYRKVLHADARDVLHAKNLGEMRPRLRYDLVIFGDVLEHLTVLDAVRVFCSALSISRYVLVSVPIIHYPQSAVGGNHHEIHLIEDPQKDLLPVLAALADPLFSWRYSVTGTFIYPGKVVLR